MKGIINPLQTLLEDSNTLIPESNNLISVKRNLHELSNAAIKIIKKGTYRGQQAESVAAIYFSSRGFNLNHHLKKITKLQTKPCRTLKKHIVTDLPVKNYLENYRQKSIAKVLRDFHFSIERYFQEKCEKQLKKDWKDIKEKISYHLGNNKGKNYPKEKLLEFSQEKIEKLEILEDLRYYSEATKYFAISVARINDPLLDNKIFKPVIKYQKEAQKIFSLTTSDSNRKKAFIQSWEILSFLVGERKLENNGKVLLTDTKPYYRNHYEPLKKKSLKQELVFHAKQALEFQYNKHIKKQLSESSLSRYSEPCIEYDVQNFVNEKFTNSISKDYEHVIFENYQSLPLWPVIYYCIRCGCITGALKAAIKGNPNKIHAMVLALDHLNQNPNKHLPNFISKQLITEFNKHCIPSPSEDPFKFTTYCIIAKIESDSEVLMTKVNLINASIEDYIWLKLNMICEKPNLPLAIETNTKNYIYSKKNIFSRLTLKELQNEFLINKNVLLKKEETQPYFYFNILLILQQFELSVLYLEKNGNIIEALHIALSLNYYGLIHYKSKYNPYVHLEKLTSCVVNEIVEINCELGFYYFYLLNGISNIPKLFEKIIVEKLSESICDTKIIGMINSRQIKINGSLSQFMKLNQMYKIILKAATKAEFDGNFKQSITLYTFSGAFNNITEMLIRLLGRVVSKLPTDLRKKEYVDFVQKFFTTYMYHSTNHPRGKDQQLIDLQNFTDLQFLLKISEIWNYFYHGTQHYNQVIKMIDKLKLFPSLEIFLKKKGKNTFSIKYGKKIEVLRKCGKVFQKVFSSLYDLLLNVLIYKIKYLLKKKKYRSNYQLRHDLRLIQYFMQRLEIHFEKINIIDNPLILEKFRKIKKICLEY